MKRAEPLGVLPRAPSQPLSKDGGAERSDIPLLSLIVNIADAEAGTVALGPPKKTTEISSNALRRDIAEDEESSLKIVQQTSRAEDESVKKLQRTTEDFDLPPGDVAANGDAILFDRQLEVLKVALEEVDARTIIERFLDGKLSLPPDRHTVPVDGEERAGSAPNSRSRRCSVRKARRTR